MIDHLIEGGTLIYWHWEAMIISFLAVRTTVLPFYSMEEMATKTNFKVVVQPGTSYVDTFRLSNNPMLKEIYSDRIEPYIEDYPQVIELPNEWVIRPWLI